MSENAVVTIVNGLKHLIKHPSLFVPDIVYYAVFIFLAVFLAFFDLFKFMEIMQLKSITIISLLIILFIILLTSFIEAGSIGMAKEVVSTGQTSYKHLFSYGKKYTLRLVFAIFFIVILRSVSAVFWTPVLKSLGSSEYGTDYVINALTNDPSLLIPMMTDLAAPVFFATLGTSLYLMLISFMFYFVAYIIIIDDMSVFKSYRMSFRLLRKRPIRIVSFVFLVTLIELLATAVSVLSSAVLSYSGFSLYSGVFIHLVISILLAAAMNVWTARFYMILTDKETAPC